MSITKGDVAYCLVKSPVRMYLQWLFNIKIIGVSLKDVKGAYLLLGNHVTNEDPIMANACANRLVRFIVGDANHDNRLKRFLLGIFEGIPFTKNSADAKSIRELLRHTKIGRPVGLYPEGGRNWDGATDKLVPSTGKLIKLLKIPVYATIFKGGYLSRPRWATYPRKGKLVLEVKQLLSEDAIASKTAAEIQALLVEKLDYNEHLWQKQQRIPFRGKNLAEHIQRLLYICPSCKAVNTIYSRGDDFFCGACDHRYGINQFGEISGYPGIGDTAAWNLWQRGFLPGILAGGFTFVSEDLSFWRQIGGHWQKDIVRLEFTQDKLEFRGKKSEETVLISNIRSLSITFQDLVEFYQGQVKYRLRFDPRKHMSVKLFYDLLGTVLGSMAKGN